MYKTILVPVDVSEPSSWHNALPAAVELARAFGARLYVTTVVRDVDAIWKAQYSLIAYDDLVADAERRLTSIIVDLVPTDLMAERDVRQGSVYGEILQAAGEIDADLIVMASHRPEMKGYLIGANAAKVVRHATCSVLIVRDR